MIDPNEILFVESQNHKVRIKTQHGEYLTRSDLNILEQKLNPRLFFRCHKGYLVNLKKIKEIVPLDRTFEIIMRSGDKVLLSREREKVLREKFEIK
jgi:DNA-binding LytR/AlgR family response regulator